MVNYDVREITYGTEASNFTPILADGTYGTPKVFTGLRSATVTTEQTQSNRWADNRLHMVLNGAKTSSGEITTWQFSEDFYPHIGFKKNLNGVVSDGAGFQNFAFQYVRTVQLENGQQFRELVIIYNVKASVPTSTDETKTEEIPEKIFTIPFTALPSPSVLDDDGMDVTVAYFRETEENKALFDLYLTEVITPQTVAPDPVV